MLSAVARAAVPAVTLAAPGRTDVVVTMRTMFDPRAEWPALRRAAILLQRACEGGADEDFAVLLAGVANMQRAAAARRLVDLACVDRMTATLSRMAPLSCSRGSSMEHIVRCNAMTEMRELLLRLAASEAVAEETAALQDADHIGV